MKKACIVISGPYLNGELFNRNNEILNRDNCLQMFHVLQDLFRIRGFDLNTQDVNPREKCDLIIYNEMPAVFPTESEKRKSALLLFESELIRPDNWIVMNHKYFEKVFTWDDRFVDGKKYIKFNFSHQDKTAFPPFDTRKGFCTLIAGNKDVNHSLELYSHRKAAIRWFEKYHPTKFRFFGMGWDKYTFKGSVFLRTLNRIKFLRSCFAEKWPSYGGPVADKMTTLSGYKFSICYENARGIPGYITEKIFDSMSAGCVPVYWGAPNISSYVPQNCFIKKEDFTTYEDLFEFLKSISVDQYDDYITNMKIYLNSEKHKQFTAAQVALVIVNALTQESPPIES